MRWNQSLAALLHILGSCGEGALFSISQTQVFGTGFPSPQCTGSQAAIFCHQEGPSNFLKTLRPSPPERLDVEQNVHVLSVRGGDSSLSLCWWIEPEKTAKVVTMILVTNCLQGIYFPEQYRKRYQLPSSACLDFRYRYILFTSASYVLATALLLFTRVSMRHALAANFLLCSYPSVKAIASGVGEKLGFDNTGQYLAVTMNLGVSGALLLQARVAWFLIKLLSTFAAMNGVAMILIPKTMDRVWGFPSFSAGLRNHPAVLFNRYLGSIALGYAIFCYSIAARATYRYNAIDVLQSMGYANIPVLSCLVFQNLVTRNSDDFNPAKRAQRLDIVLLFVMIWSTLICRGKQ